MVDPISLPEAWANAGAVLQMWLPLLLVLLGVGFGFNVIWHMTKWKAASDFDTPTMGRSERKAKLNPIEDHMDIDIQTDEKPKRFSGIGPDGELLTPIEDGFGPAEKPKRGIRQQPRYWLWLLGGFATGLFLMVLAYNLIPGLRPADQHVYPADDRPHVVATPATSDSSSPKTNKTSGLFEASDWAFGVVDVFLIITGLGFGIGLIRHFVVVVKQAFQ